MKNFLIAAVFGLILSVQAAPGNVFVEGEEVTAPVPAGAVGVELFDIDGTRCFSGLNPADGRLSPGKIPVGFYRLEYTVDGKRAFDSITVLPTPTPTLNPNGPIALDAALFYPFFRRSVGATKFSYTPDDVVGLLRKANLSYVRERIMWSEFNDLDTPNQLIDSLVAAYAGQGIKVVQSLYGTPPQFRYPAELSALGGKKPPLNLANLHDYIRKLTARFGDAVPAIESWNEPEGIGGALLSFETAAVQKAAMLGARRANPDQISFMGNGSLEYPQNLLDNELNVYQNAFCFHSHSSLAQTNQRAVKYMPATESLPVWMTEVSTGSFKLDPATGELSPELARRQALDIPKLCAMLLDAGADKLFYFFLFHHNEVSGNSYGLLRPGDLMPRPGFATLATLAKYFQNFHAIQKLDHLADGLHGYAARVTFEGKPYEIKLLWSDAPAKFRAGDATFARDAFGRTVELAAGEITLSDMPVYLFTPGAFETAPASAKTAGPLSPVVLNLELPDNIKNTSADKFTLPVGEKRTYPLAVYNFSDTPVSGKLTVTFPNGEADVVTLDRIEIPADSRVELPLEFRLERLPLQPEAPSRLVIAGDFGSAGRTKLVADINPVRAVLLPGDTETPIPGWQDAANWRKYIIKGSEMNIESEADAIRFDFDFGPAENQVIAHVWASPTLPLNIRDFPEYVPDALAFEALLTEGDGLETMGLNLVEDGGATYFATVPFAPEKLRVWQKFIVPLPTMINPRFRKKDDNGRLDPEKLTSVELPIWAKPGAKIKIAMRNLRWINYQKEKAQMKKLIRPLLAAVAAATVATLPAEEPAGTPIRVANADFTSAKADGTPEKWGITGVDPNFSVKIVDGTLQMEAKAKTKWYSTYIAPASVKALPELKPGEICRIEFSYRQKNRNLTGRAFGTIEIRDAKHRRLAHRDGDAPATDSDWSDRKVVLDLKEIPNGAEYILLSFFLGEATGNAWFDDVKLTVKTLPAPEK